MGTSVHNPACSDSKLGQVCYSCKQNYTNLESDYDFCSCSIHYINSSTDSVLFKPADLIHSNVDHRLLLVLYGFFYIVGILGC